MGRLWCAPTPYYTGFYPLEWSDATWAGRSAAPVPMATLLDDLGESADEIRERLHSVAVGKTA